MSQEQMSSHSPSQLASEYSNCSLFAGFDFQRPPTLPSSSKSGIRRWAGKWHTSPQDYEYWQHDDTHPLNPTFKRHKPHVKSIFQEYELDEFHDTSTVTPVVRFSGDAFENEDVWSTIAITSIKSPEPNENEPEKEDTEVVSDTMGKSIRLTIEKIEKRGSIAKKQKDRKQVSAFPAKAKQFFTSIKNVFRSKTAKSNHLSMIEIPTQKERSISTENARVCGTPVDTESCALEKNVGEESSQHVTNDTSTNAEDKNIFPDPTTRTINQSRSRSNTWQDDDIIVKRKDEADNPMQKAVEKDIVKKIERKSGRMTVFETIISLQKDEGVSNCEVDTM